MAVTLSELDETQLQLSVEENKRKELEMVLTVVNKHKERMALSCIKRAVNAYLFRARLKKRVLLRQVNSSYVQVSVPWLCLLLLLSCATFHLHQLLKGLCRGS